MIYVMSLLTIIEVIITVMIDIKKEKIKDKEYITRGKEI